MKDSASDTARDAKALQQSLRDLLKTRDPWDREVEFQRKNLRRQYLHLLLIFPHARESKDIETHLWMQTSYQFISVYKQRVATLDRTLQSAPRNAPRQNEHGPVEYRKLMQRFRQFLAEEEKFWVQLVARYRRSFALHEASAALAAIGIQSDSGDAASANPSDAPDNDTAHGFRNGRNNNLFPQEDKTQATPPADSAERENRLSTLSKALICLGDIARYRELYNESGGRPKAGHEDGPAKRNRSRRNTVPDVARTRNYDKSSQCYEQARLLVPNEGNASHQLAILAFYKKDMFSSLIHYYKALCVRQPYDTASENMGTMLNKAVEQWKARRKGDKAKVEDDKGLPPPTRVVNMKEKTLVLHALWRFGAEKVGPMPPDFPTSVTNDFAALVSERILPIEAISKVIALSQGALWKHRMIRESYGTGKNAGPAESPISIESNIATHVLALHRTLLQVGIDELAVAPPEDAAENDLAQRITAVFRRTLPALRIASKWLSANFKYVIQAQGPTPTGVTGAPHKMDANTSNSTLTISDMPAFWTAYMHFYSALLRSFPMDKLPALSAPLEEDIDMKGFLPLRKLMSGEVQTTGDAGQRSKPGGNSTVQGREVHPNEEQLMRISDLLQDANAMVTFEGSPFTLQDGVFKERADERDSGKGSDKMFSGAVTAKTLQTEEVYTPPILGQMFSMWTDANGYRPQHFDQEEDAMTEVTRTDDDPVDEAFRQVLNLEDFEEEEDKIVWDIGAPHGGPSMISALHNSPPIISPKTPVRPSTNLSAPTGVVSPRLPPVSPPAVSSRTTAEDLLNTFISPKGANQISRSQTTSISTVPQSRLLYGSGPNEPGRSIWSIGDMPAFSGVGSLSPQSTSQLSSQQWSSSFQSPQNSQSLLPGVPTTSFAPQPFASRSPGHHHKSFSVTSSVPRPHVNQSPNQDFPGLSLGPAPYCGQQSHALPPAIIDPAVVSTSRSGLAVHLPIVSQGQRYQNLSQCTGAGNSLSTSYSWANTG